MTREAVCEYLGVKVIDAPVIDEITIDAKTNAKKELYSCSDLMHAESPLTKTVESLSNAETYLCPEPEIRVLSGTETNVPPHRYGIKNTLAKIIFAYERKKTEKFRVPNNLFPEKNDERRGVLKQLLQYIIAQEKIADDQIIETVDYNFLKKRKLIDWTAKAFPTIFSYIDYSFPDKYYFWQAKEISAKHITKYDKELLLKCVVLGLEKARIDHGMSIGNNKELAGVACAAVLNLADNNYFQELGLLEPMRIVYGGIKEAIKQFMPEAQDWQFKSCKNNHWKDDNNVRAALEWILSKEECESREDIITKLTRQDFIENRLDGMLNVKFESSVYRAMKYLMPGIFKKEDFRPGRTKGKGTTPKYRSAPKHNPRTTTQILYTKKIRKFLNKFTLSELVEQISKPTNCTDKLLPDELNIALLKAKLGCQASFERIAKTYEYSVKKFTSKYCFSRNEYDDYHQAVLIGLHNAVEDYDGSIPFFVFANLCMDRKVLVHLRTNTNRRNNFYNTNARLDRPFSSEDERTLGHKLQAANVLTSGAPHDSLIEKELLRETLSSLTVMEKKAVFYNIYSGYSLLDIAEITNRSYKSIDNARTRAVRKIRERFQRAEFTYCN